MPVQQVPLESCRPLTGGSPRGSPPRAEAQANWAEHDHAGRAPTGRDAGRPIVDRLSYYAPQWRVFRDHGGFLLRAVVVCLAGARTGEHSQATPDR